MNPVGSSIMLELVLAVHSYHVIAYLVLARYKHFNLITSFIQDSADKHIPSKTSRMVSSVPWITSEIRRKIRRRNKTHA